MHADLSVYQFIGLSAQAGADLSVYRFIGLSAQAGADLSVYRFIGLSAQAGKNRPCHHAVIYYIDVNLPWKNPFHLLEPTHPKNSALPWVFVQGRFPENIPENWKMLDVLQ